MLHKFRNAFDSTISIVNSIKSTALNSRLFTLLWEDIDSDHKVLLFHIEVRWLSKGNMLTRLYELKEEVILFLEFKEKQFFANVKEEWGYGVSMTNIDSMPQSISKKFA